MAGVEVPLPVSRGEGLAVAEPLDPVADRLALGIEAVDEVDAGQADIHGGRDRAHQDDGRQGRLVGLARGEAEPARPRGAMGAAVEARRRAVEHGARGAAFEAIEQQGVVVRGRRRHGREAVRVAGHLGQAQLVEAPVEGLHVGDARVARADDEGADGGQASGEGAAVMLDALDVELGLGPVGLGGHVQPLATGQRRVGVEGERGRAALDVEAQAPVFLHGQGEADATRRTAGGHRPERADAVELDPGLQGEGRAVEHGVPGRLDVVVDAVEGQAEGAVQDLGLRQGLRGALEAVVGLGVA